MEHFFHILGTIIPTDYIGLKAPTRYCRQKFMTSSSSLFEGATDRPGIPVSHIFRHTQIAHILLALYDPWYACIIYIHIMGIYIYMYVCMLHVCVYIYIYIYIHHILSYLHKLCHYGCFFPHDFGSWNPVASCGNQPMLSLFNSINHLYFAMDKNIPSSKIKGGHGTSTTFHDVFPITLWLCQNSYWKWRVIVDFPIKHGDFP